MIVMLVLGYFKQPTRREPKLTDHILVKKSKGKGKRSDVHIFNMRLEEMYSTIAPFKLNESDKCFGKDNLFKIEKSP